MAVAYVVDRAHVQYAGALDEEDAAGIVSGAVGQSGGNEDYVFNTVTHMKALGIRDHWLEGVARRLSEAPQRPASAG
jgi:cation transport protein ChaC